jgi:hypothetical protein
MEGSAVCRGHKKRPKQQCRCELLIMDKYTEKQGKASRLLRHFRILPELWLIIKLPFIFNLTWSLGYGIWWSDLGIINPTYKQANKIAQSNYN